MSGMSGLFSEFPYYYARAREKTSYWGQAPALTPRLFKLFFMLERTINFDLPILSIIFIHIFNIIKVGECFFIFRSLIPVIELLRFHHTSVDGDGAASAALSLADPVIM